MQVLKFLIGAALFLAVLVPFIWWFGRPYRRRDPRDYLTEKCERASDERTGAGSPRAPS